MGEGRVASQNVSKTVKVKGIAGRKKQEEKEGQAFPGESSRNCSLNIALGFKLSRPDFRDKQTKILLV